MTNPFSLPLRDYDINPFIHPTQATSGKKGRMTADGREYVDLVCAWGTNLLGYGYRRVSRAAARQAKKFSSLGIPHPEFKELALLLNSFIPGAEVVRYGKNGSDVCAGAIRLARAITGRQKVAYRGYHGFHDWYMASTAADGIPGVLGEALVPLPEMTAESIDETLGRYPGEFAAIISNPVVGPYPSPEEAKGALEACHRHGALMIYDEMMSGFRIANGGFQEALGVKPDLSCFGKSIANGLPLAVLCGRVESMNELPRTAYGMTFEAEAVSIAAAIATVREVLEKQVVHQLHLKGQRLRAHYMATAQRLGVDTVLAGFDPCLHFGFGDHGSITGRELKWLMVQELLANRVFTAGSFILCYQHGLRDLRHIENAVEASMEKVRQAIDRDTVEGLLDPRVHGAMHNITAPGTWRHQKKAS